MDKKYEDIMEKYGDLEEEEVEALPAEEKEKVYEALEHYKAEAEKEAEEVKKAVEALSEEEKQAMADSIKQAQALAQEQAQKTEAEKLAEMMNPDYEEVDIIAAQEMMEASDKETAEEVMAEAIEKQMEMSAKRGLIQTIKRLIKRIFK